MKDSKSHDCYVANNAEDLLSALKIKANTILITKYYKEEIMGTTALPLPADAFVSGTRVAASAGGNPVFLLMNFFSKRDKQQRKIDSKVQKYMLKKHDEDLLLYLRQRDY